MQVNNLIGQPRVTVIIPVYNGEETLARAVDSVLAQTEKSLEIFIIDDCSTDGSWGVATHLAERHGRITLHRNPENRGKPFAVNLATDRARGVWIAILDADDWYAPTRLGRLLEEAESYDVPMAADNQFFVDGQAGRTVGTAFRDKASMTFLDLDRYLRTTNPTLNFDYGMLKPVFRADFLRSHAIRYYEQATVGQDFYILLSFFVAGGRAVVLDAPLYYYVQPFGSVSRRWAQTTRQRYRFELLLEIHRQIMQVLEGRVSDAHTRLLARRARGISTMVAFHQIRECLAERKAGKACRLAAKAPLWLWRMAASRLVRRFFRFRRRSGHPVT